MKQDLMTAMISRRADLTRAALDQLPGVKWTSPHQAILKTGMRQAHVTLHADDSISFHLPGGLPESPWQALAVSSTLPGNLRFAVLAKGPGLAADTRLDGHLHLPASFDMVRLGVQQAVGKKLHEEPQLVPVSAEILQHAVEELAWPEDAIVRHDDSWELRPNVQGRAVAVQVTLAGGRIELRRFILNVQPGNEATLWQALRYNACIRHARLAVRDSALVVETQLHGGQASGDWLDFAARAVACTSRHVEATLRLIAQQPAVAQMYLRVFPVAQSPGLAAAPAE